MAFESGEQEKSTPSSPSIDELYRVIGALQKQVESLSQNSPLQQQSVASGMSPEQFALFLRAAKEKETEFEDGLVEEEIPIEDFDETGVIFYSPCAGRVICDDVRKGRRVKLPHNKKLIFFEYEATRKIIQGKHQFVAPFSKYKSHSKKEIEWLRNHTGYRIQFYESSTEAANADMLLMRKLSAMAVQLANYDLPSIIKMCKDYNVTPSDDPQVMRHYLAIAMAKKEMESEGIKSQSILEENMKEKLLKTSK